MRVIIGFAVGSPIALRPAVLACLTTGPALAAIRHTNRVAFVEWMAPQAVSFSCVLGSRALAPQHIFPERDDFDVRRIDAGSIAADMVANHAGRNHNPSEFAGGMMRIDSRSPESELSIAIARPRAKPHPAGVRAARPIGQTPESFGPLRRSRCLHFSLFRDCRHARSPSEVKAQLEAVETGTLGPVRQERPPQPAPRYPTRISCTCAWT